MFRWHERQGVYIVAVVIVTTVVIVTAVPIDAIIGRCGIYPIRIAIAICGMIRIGILLKDFAVCIFCRLQTPLISSADK